MASLDGSQSISTSEVGLMCLHVARVVCHSLRKGVSPLPRYFSPWLSPSSKSSVGLAAAGPSPTGALQSLICVGFSHQQQGVVKGMVTAFLYFAATTNSLEVL